MQRDFLAKFFARESHFFLSGGAALAGFYLGHRQTEDLDLFTLVDEIDRGFQIVSEAAIELSAEIEPIHTSPAFRRILVRRNEEAIVVDLVRESVFQLNPVKPLLRGIRIDTPEEILANKLCTLLSRAELRDLVDVRALELAGFPIEAALSAAAQKDSGLTAAQLAWVLKQIQLGDEVVPPGDVSLVQLRSYLDELLGRLARIAFSEQSL